MAVPPSGLRCHPILDLPVLPVLPIYPVHFLFAFQFLLANSFSFPLRMKHLSNDPGNGFDLVVEK